MKYCPGVPMCAPSGLRTHICQVPSAAATRKAANATQKWARHNRSAFRTGNPPVRFWYEVGLRHHLHGRVHLAVAKAAVLVTRHEQIASPRELGMHLSDKSGNDHGVD